MKHSLFNKMLSGLLATIMLLAAMMSVPVSAAEGTTGEGGTTSEEQGTKYPGYFDNYVDPADVAKFLGLKTYEQYSKKYRNVPKATQTITINAVDYDAEKTTADVTVQEAGWMGSTQASLLTPSNGATSWTFEVPEEGMYAMRITYTTPEGTYTTVERMLSIDGSLPFSEARYFYLPRSWQYEYLEKDENGEPVLKFEQDVNNNDVRPRREEDPIWVTYFMRDWLGYTMDPFELYLSKGTHTITLDAAREPLAITTIEFYRYDEEPTFEEYFKDKTAAGAQIVTGVDNIVIEAEHPVNISNANLIPGNDRTSCLTTPQDPAVIKYNVLSTGAVNNWMTYEVEVEKAGFYSIACRYRQNSLIGMFTSRRIYINDEIQFREASNLRFVYSPDWQCNVVTDGSDQELLFYLEEGVNTIKVEVVLGQMEEYVYRIKQIIDSLETAYQKFLKITGPVPDSYRDYRFEHVAPDAIDALGDAAEALYTIADELIEITGELGDQVQTLQTYALTFERMYEDPYEIAPKFLTFKNYIIGLTNWLYASLSQPLNVDKWVVGSQGNKLPQAQANFFQQAWFEINAFIQSFFMDYTTIGRKGDVVLDESTSIELWVSSAGGREDALIQRHLIDNHFTPKTNISVTIKVITAGLTEAILAGIGPDLASMGTNDTITWGMRNAVECLNAKDENGNYIYNGYEEVISWFDPTLINLVTMEGKVYGMPNGMSFSMMFYRSDVFAEMGLAVPETWEDLYDILPSLMNQHLEVGVPSDPTLFIYQNGTTLYKEDDPAHMGWECNLSSDVALKAFAQMTDFFTKYKCDVSYDLTRFRTGEYPLVIGDGIGTYNTLMGMVDIRGLWEMTPLPGVRQEDGSINRTSLVGTSTFVIPRGANNPQSTWEYIKWNLCEETQLLFYKESMMVSGNPTAKVSMSNLSAIRKQAWTESELIAINAQLEQLASVPEYPGNYIIGVYVSNAFYDVYNAGTDPITAMQDRVLDINKEISRKRKEFGLGYYDISFNREEKAERN